ncbi:MAG TPA: hypothetical protein VIJ14_02285, partial [Rhabdochlamydiaceae bacterium]
MANNITSNSLSSRRRNQVWTSYEAPPPKKSRKINDWQTVTADQWTTYVKPLTSSSVSTDLPPVAAKVYNLRSRVVIVRQPPVSITGETESKIPEGPETAARTVPYVRNSKRLYDLEEVQPLSSDSSSSEIELNLLAPPPVLPPLDKEPLEEVQPLSPGP